jgi:RNA polymerase sigma factor (sigma-70 family)
MDQQQQKKIFDIYFPQLTVFVYRMIDNKDLAEDITMECFSKLFKNRFEFKSEEILPFLYVRAKHAALSHLKRNKQAAEHTPMDFDTHETDKKVILNEEFKQKLYNQIDLLTPQLKEVALLSIQDLSIAEIADKMCISKNAVSKLKGRAINSLRKELLNNSHEASNNIPGHVSIIKDEINIELIKYFAKHPHKIHDIDPSKFEKLVAELMKDMGYDVYHTPQTRDGGRDIIAVLKTPSNDPIITIVECKRHRADKPVGIEIVRSFLYTLREQDKANAGWIVTTSNFSEDALNKQKEYKWLLSLKNNKNLAAWCSNYGQWKRPGGSGGLWLPNNPLA